MSWGSGRFDNLSAYRFESYYGMWKKYQDKPIQQLVKLIIEEVQNQSFDTWNIDVCNDIEFFDRYNSEPVLENIRDLQFREKILWVGHLKSDEE